MSHAGGVDFSFLRSWRLTEFAGTLRPADDMIPSERAFGRRPPYRGRRLLSYLGKSRQNIMKKFKSVWLFPENCDTLITERGNLAVGAAGRSAGPFGRGREGNEVLEIAGRPAVPVGPGRMRRTAGRRAERGRSAPPQSRRRRRRQTAACLPPCWNGRPAC